MRFAPTRFLSRLPRGSLAFVAIAALAACRPHPFTALAEAAARGDTTEVRRLVASGDDPDGHDGPGGWTPLMSAAREGRPATIRTLLALGADPNRADASPNRWTPLLHAIHKNQFAAVVALLDGGADPNLGAVDGPTPLISAAGSGDVAIVRALLAAGADPRRQSGAVSPLSAAVGTVPDVVHFRTTRCRTETVRLLLQAAPDLRLPTAFPERTGRLVARLGGCQEVLKLLEGR